jgi:hypothetical protein
VEQDPDAAWDLQAMKSLDRRSQRGCEREAEEEQREKHFQLPEGEQPDDYGGDHEGGDEHAAGDFAHEEGLASLA